MWRKPGIVVGSLVLALASPPVLEAQQLPFWVDSVAVTPPNPGGVGAVKLSGNWIDTCVPDSVSHTQSGGVIDLEVTQPGIGVGCGDAITPWTLTEEFGPLPPGEFQIRGSLVSVNPNNRDQRELLSGPDLLFSSITIPQGRFHGLGNLPDRAYVSEAFDVSADGHVVVGHNELAPGTAGLITREAFAFTPGTGMFPLGRLPNVFSGGSTARGVSANGNVIVGDSDSRFGVEAFRWTLGSGMQGLGGLIETSHSMAAAASHDGSIVVGGNEFFPPSQPDPPFPGRLREAFRWTRENGMIGLGQVHPGGMSWATDTSATGDVIVGNATPNPFIEIAFPDISEPFRWTAGSGMVGLGHLQHPLLELADFTFPIQLETTAEAVSSGGETIVGTSRVFFGDTGNVFLARAYRWTREEGFIDLGDPNLILPALPLAFPDFPLDPTRPDVVIPHVFTDLRAVDVSSDGELIVGVGELSFRLPRTSSDAQPAPGAVPEVFPPSNFEFSFVWDEARGMRLLEDVLINDFGFGASGQLDGWRLGRVAAISDDGTTLVGTGINPHGIQEAWRVVLGRMTLPGDADFDGDVDRDDLAIWRQGFGKTEGAKFVEGDFDYNGNVDGDDLLTLLLEFGNRSAAFLPAGGLPIAIPEPGTVWLAGVSLLLAGVASARHHRGVRKFR